MFITKNNLNLDQWFGTKDFLFVENNINFRTNSVSNL